MKYLFTFRIKDFQRIKKIDANFTDREIEEFLSEVDNKYVDLPFMVNCGNTVDVFDFIEEMKFNEENSIKIQKMIIDNGKDNDELFLKIQSVIIHKNYIELYFEK
ncbi:hypothetical protein [Chryseobacterium sp. 5_R23647]|uniref:hypothetical protein n=1 Tax=Chryseobacterium sp. 5_R23647 TaxID=2258964 RepID=UPI000E2554AD|nr:hypothetical protein [Chryseobacterium sp. 5_R23647]REC40507.1 hypothetical protein DRF69_18610 [Chryseobacterium sp. 5_R23647]